MFCGNCGNQMSNDARFCGVCGKPTEAGAQPVIQPPPMVSPVEQQPVMQQPVMQQPVMQQPVTSSPVPMQVPYGQPAQANPGPGIKPADEIDYQIYGDDMQMVEVELDPGESVLAEAGAMMYMEDAIQMETVFGDGSGSEGKGFMNKLIGAGKRALAGESLFMTVFTNQGTGKSHVAFAAPYPGKIIPVELKEFGTSLICQKDAFLCAAKGVSIGIHIQKRIGAGFFGGEGFIMEKLTGDGLVFLHAGGTIIKKELKPGETLRLDTGCLVAISETVEYDVAMAGGIKTSIFGGEGLFLATLKGPGHVWLQSLPFSKMADKIVKASGGHSENNSGFNNPLGEIFGGN